jgi:putative transposase
MEIGSRRILHCNVTAHPTAEWTTQQFREVFDDGHPYQFVIHDHDSIFSASLDAALSDFGLRILRTPVQAPTAIAYCERLAGRIRRECLDYLIPMNERHLNLTLKEFVVYYNRARPHSALGPGTPEPILPSVATSSHQFPTGYRIRSKPVLGGLHHDYRLERP